MTEKRIVYFDEITEANTEHTLRAAKKRADELGIKDIIVSSTRGETALKALDHFKGGYNVIVVTHSASFREPGKIEMSDETRVASCSPRCTVSPAWTGPSIGSSTL